MLLFSLVSTYSLSRVRHSTASLLAITLAVLVSVVSRAWGTLSCYYHVIRCGERRRLGSESFPIPECDLSGVFIANISSVKDSKSCPVTYFRGACFISSISLSLTLHCHSNFRDQLSNIHWDLKWSKVLSKWILRWIRNKSEWIQISFHQFKPRDCLPPTKYHGIAARNTWPSCSVLFFRLFLLVHIKCFVRPRVPHHIITYRERLSFVLF